jgi:predicted kinase
MECVLLVGIPASGKSSFCAGRFARTHLRLNLDMLRTRHREAELLATCLRLQQPFVVDNTNVSAAERARFVVPAKAAGFRVVGYYLASKLDECLPRNAARSGEARVPDVAVRDMARRLELPALTEGFDALHYVRMAGGEFVVEDWRDEVR